MKLSFRALIVLFSVLSFVFIECTPKTAAKIEGQEKIVVEEPNNVNAPLPPVEASSPDIPFDPAVKIGVLANGMKYYIRKNSKPENRAELRLVVGAGATQEDEDQLGLAHFVEHMCFNGSTNFAKNELVDFLESVGTRFGPDLNAYTSFDETVYMLQVRTDDQEIFDKGLLVLEDWAGGVRFDPEEIDKERGVVVSEWRTRLSGEQRMQQVYFPIMYKNSRYAERLPIGDPDIIENASYETVKRYYKDWYRPNLMAVIVVGDVDVAAVETAIKTKFSKLTNPENPRERKKYDVPGHEETLISICSDTEASFGRVNMMIKHEHAPMRTLEDFRASQVRNLYNRMLGNRLSEISKKPDPPFMFGYSGYGGDVGSLDTYRSFAQFTDGKADEALQTLLEENERVLRFGFTESELERAKKIILENYDRRFKEKDKTNSRRMASSYIRAFLKGLTSPSVDAQMEYANEYIPGISIEEVNALAAKWITKENRFILITGPEKENAPLPTEDEVRQIVTASANVELEPYVDEVITKPLFSGTLKPVEIIDEKTYENVSIKQFTLANGVKVITKKTDFQNNEILLSATSEGGTSLYPDEDYLSASNASSLITEGGVGEFNAIQLQKLLTGKTVRVSPYIGGRYEGFSGSAAPEDMETMFQLINLYVTAPRKDPDAFSSFVTKQKGFFQNLMSNPQFYFMNTSQKIKYGDNLRMKWPTSEDWDKVSLDRAFEIYNERFADASDFTFIFVGNFDEVKLRDAAQRYLGNLPSLNRTETWKDLGININQGTITKNIKKGKAPKTQVELFYHGDYEWNAKNNYVFQSMISLLRIKMRESMREDKGGVYGVGVRGSTSKYPNEKYNIIVSFNCDPENTDVLIETAMNDIKNAQMNGAEEKDLNKVKETQRQGMVKDLRENRFWNRRIEYFYEHGLDFNTITLEALEKHIEALQSADIKNASNSYFQEGNSIKLVMEPEAKPAN
jgi:zinc protease